MELVIESANRPLDVSDTPNSPVADAATTHASASKDASKMAARAANLWRLACVKWSDRIVHAEHEKTRVLVVDDFEPAAEALAAALDLEGFDAKFSYSGVDALRAIGPWVPHVIILDVNMPEHDGYETARIMRRLNTTKELGIIAFTALSANDMTERGKISNFDAYCQKGTPLEQLVTLIESIVD